jgi:hypothetical protein
MAETSFRTAGMKSSLSLSWQLFPPGYSAEYSLAGAVPSQRLPTFVDSCLNKLLPGEAFLQQTLTDLKGRDLSDPASKDLPPSDKPQRDELFFVGGEWFSEKEAQDAEKEEAKLTPHPFTLQAYTVFDQFVGAHHIVHKVEFENSGQLPPDTAPRLIAKITPIRLKVFRLGLEVFESKLFASMLGFAPAATQTFFIESDEASFRLELTAEGLKSRSSLPLASNNLLNRLQAIMLQIFQFNLLEDYSIKAH